MLEARWQRSGVQATGSLTGFTGQQSGGASVLNLDIEPWDLGMRGMSRCPSPGAAGQDSIRRRYKTGGCPPVLLVATAASVIQLSELSCGFFAHPCTRAVAGQLLQKRPQE